MTDRRHQFAAQAIVEEDDTPTVLPGVSLRGRGRRRRVVVDLDELRADRTIAGLAGYFHLSPARVLRELLDKRVNRHVILPLYHSIGEQVDPRHRERLSVSAARRRLRRRAAQRPVVVVSATGLRERPDYFTWDLADGEIRRAIVLPLSDGFVRALAQADERERQVRADAQRRQRIRQLEPVTRRLDVSLRQIRSATYALRRSALQVGQAMRTPAQELAVVNALTGMLGLMINQPADDAHPSASALRRNRMMRTLQRRRLDKANTLLRRTRRLRQLAQRHFLTQPVFGGRILRQRDRLASALMSRLDSTQLLADVRALAANVDLITPDQLDIACESLATAVRALAGTNEAPRLNRNHLTPLIQALASLDLDLSWLPASDRSAIARGLRDRPPAPSRPSAVVELGKLAAGTLPQALGNVEGPDSLALASFEAFAIAVSAHYRGREVQASVPRLLRAVMKIARLNNNEQAALLQAVKSADMEEIRAAPWARSFMGGRGFGAMVAVCSFISMILAITDDDAATIERWSDIVAGATGTALGLAASLKSFGKLLEKGAFTSLELNVGQALGFVGALAVFVAGSANVVESVRNNDTIGAVIHGTSAVGGLVTAAGFLVSAGLFADATLIGLPAGTVLMIAGGILMIGAAIWGTIRNLTRSNVEITFEAFLEHFGRDGSHYRRVITLRPDLRAAYDNVKRYYRGVSFWHIHLDTTPQLHDLGFSVANISDLTDYVERNIRRRLRAANRSVESVYALPRPALAT